MYTKKYFKFVVIGLFFSLFFNIALCPSNIYGLTKEEYLEKKKDIDKISKIVNEFDTNDFTLSKNYNNDEILEMVAYIDTSIVNISCVYSDDNGNYSIYYNHNKKGYQKSNRYLDMLFDQQNNFKDFKDDYSRVKFIANSLSDFSYYTGSLCEGNNNDKGEYVNSPDALVNGGGYCGAYANMFKLALDRLNIPNRFMLGKSSDGELHTWNYVSIDNKWYHIDVQQPVLYDYNSFITAGLDIYNDFEEKETPPEELIKKVYER